MERKQRTLFQAAPFCLRRTEKVSRKSFEGSRSGAVTKRATLEHAAKGMMPCQGTQSQARF